jgi:hypothetical protein
VGRRQSYSLFGFEQPNYWLLSGFDQPNYF